MKVQILIATALLAACSVAPRARAVAGPPLPAPLDREAGSDSRAWVESTLASLSLREKVAQLVMPWVGGEYAAVDSPEFDQLLQWVEEEKVGGLILSIGLPHSYAAKLNELQRRADVPLFVTSDMENGPGMRLAGIYSLPHLLRQGGGTDFPPVMALGATRSESLARELGRVLGREARAVGVHMTFGPVLDVNSNPLNPIINVRSFGEDPALVARLGTAYIEGAREAGLMTTAKHYPGHGDTEADSHIELPVIAADRARMDRVELVPFRAAVEAGVDGIMAAHIAVVGVEGPDAPPTSLSRYFVTDLLRGEMGFEGLVFTDAMTMGGVSNRYGMTEPLVMALEAGADVLLMPEKVTDAIETVVAAVRSGRITESRIDASVRRLLEAKAAVGLDHDREVSLEAVDEIVAVRPHLEVAREIAERSITLARDEARVVPLPAEPVRVLALTYAEPADLMAGRAFDRALRAAGHQVDGVRVDARTTAAELESIRRLADSADVVLASAYVSPREYTGTVGAGGAFPALVEELARRKPLLAISFGNPYLLSFFPSVPGYLLAWGGREVSQTAAARAVLGEIPIGGKLPISLPPFFRFGDGLERAAREPAS